MPHTLNATSRPSRPAIRTLVAASLLILLIGCGGGQREPLPATSTSQNNAQAANVVVDEYVQAELKRQNIPGLALLVQQDGKVIYAKGYGYADLDSGTAASTEQRFQIGSISKQLLAAAVLMLVEEGKMGLDDKIGKYLGAAPAAWDAITVRHILTHTSGLQQDADGAAYEQAKTHGAYTTDQLLAVFKAYKPETAPGTSYAYSNLGYQLMGMIVEKVTGAPYGDMLQSRIFTPLGMTTARIIDFNNGAGSAAGYISRAGMLTRVRMDSYSAGEQSFVRTGAGGIEMSAGDLAKWDASLNTDKILKKSSRDQMWSAGALVQKADTYTINYGLGWFLSDYNGHPKVYHSGGMYAFTTDYLRYTNDKLSVIVLTNLGIDSSNPELISRAVANMYIPGVLPPK